MDKKLIESIIKGKSVREAFIEKFPKDVLSKLDAEFERDCIPILKKYDLDNWAVTISPVWPSGDFWVDYKPLDNNTYDELPDDLYKLDQELGEMFDKNSLIKMCSFVGTDILPDGTIRQKYELFELN